ncbi:MAG: hypothetical protein IIZ78_29520 [Clostridiales bacterium]|nr:hypothetical protein [Clostridiales bacterium]MBQ1575293.1 hypothetical protein [Clostridiales bacterium]
MIEVNEMNKQKNKAQRIGKNNKDRRMLMKLLRRLRIEIREMLADNRLSDRGKLDELFRRRTDYRKRLTKLTNKRQELRLLPET